MKTKKGMRVMMSPALKAALRGKCGEAGKHLGPTCENTCWGCSSAHVDEFGDCVGIVEGPVDYGTQKGPEVEVLWLPSRLRYGYHPDQLIPA